MTGSRAAPSTPPSEGFVERDGVRVFWEAYGEGEATIFLLPTWSLVHSRQWKAQIPYLSRHFRVVTFDGRGNGRSDRPADRDGYAEREFAADALEVMKATETDRAVIVGNSRGAQRGLLLCSEHPERVVAAVFIGPWFPVSPLHGLRWRLMTHPRLIALGESRKPISTRSWLKFNAHHMRNEYRDFIEWFIGRCLPEPHSTKQFEDMIGWAEEIGPEALILSASAERAAPSDRRSQIELARRARCPVLVIHGKQDRITHVANGRALARATGGEMIELEDAGHVPHGRRPVPVNIALREFAERHLGTGDDGAANGHPAGAAWTPDPTVHRSDGRRRALFVSSPIGLGHAQRDVAIARELRRLHPDLQIDWLAQDPVTRVLEREGESIHPASRVPGQRVQAHRERIGRARPALLPGVATHGRDPGHQLQRVRRRRLRRPLRPVDRRRGLGHRLLPAREPRARSAPPYAGSPTSSAGSRCPTAATTRPSSPPTTTPR